MKLLNDVRDAFAFLTIAPLGTHDELAPGRMFSYFPLVGLAIGLIVAWVASLRLWSPDLMTFAALAIWAILSGGLHLDGFADSCDGLLAAVTPERRLEIMKDPRAGSWAVIGVTLLLLGKWNAMRGLSPALLILPPVTGRWIMTLVVAYFPSARPSGMGARFRQGIGLEQVAIATLSAGIVAILLGERAVVALLISLALAFAAGFWASRRLGGGLTGDVYGALCELAELICLLVLSLN